MLEREDHRFILNEIREELERGGERWLEYTIEPLGWLRNQLEDADVDLPREMVATLARIAAPAGRRYVVSRAMNSQSSFGAK
jgi:hypothetical protein